MNLSDQEKKWGIQAIKDKQPRPKAYIYPMPSDEEDITHAALPFHHIEP